MLVERGNAFKTHNPRSIIDLFDSFAHDDDVCRGTLSI